MLGRQITWVPVRLIIRITCDHVSRCLLSLSGTLFPWTGPEGHEWKNNVFSPQSQRLTFISNYPNCKKGLQGFEVRPAACMTVWGNAHLIFSSLCGSCLWMLPFFSPHSKTRTHPLFQLNIKRKKTTDLSISLMLLLYNLPLTFDSKAKLRDFSWRACHLNQRCIHKFS